MRCVRCGSPLVRGKSIGVVCLDCFVATHKLLCVPEKVFFDYCKHCGSIRLGYRWLEGGDLGEAVQRYVELYFSSKERVAVCSGFESYVVSFSFEEAVPLTVPSWRTLYRVVFNVLLRDVVEPVKVEYRVEVRARPTICPLCKDARGGDYNVLLQIRGAAPARLARVLENLFNSDSRVVGSIVDIVELSNGADILLLDRGSASRILRELRKVFRVRTRVTGEDVGVTSNGKLRRRQVISAMLSERRKK